MRDSKCYGTNLIVAYYSLRAKLTVVDLHKNLFQLIRDGGSAISVQLLKVETRIIILNSSCISGLWADILDHFISTGTGALLLFLPCILLPHIQL